VREREREKKRNPARHPVHAALQYLHLSSGSITGDGGGASSPDTPPRWWCGFNSPAVAYPRISIARHLQTARPPCEFVFSSVDCCANTIIRWRNRRIDTRDIESYNFVRAVSATRESVATSVVESATGGAVMS